MPIDPYAAPSALTSPTPASEPMDGEPPSNANRFVAYLLDGLIYMVLNIGLVLALVLPMAVLAERPFMDEDLKQVLFIFGTLFWMVLALMVPPSCDLLFQRVLLGETPGHRAMGMVVVDMAGRPPSAARLFGRAVAKHLTIAFMYIIAISVFFDAKRRAPWDHIAGTRVILRDTANKT
jgi:uncharacterized RDD family membrane protein YckC